MSTITDTTVTRTDSTVDDLLTACREAKRQPHVMGTEDYPSKWDQWHEWIDLLLADWEAGK